jgi:ligand-binding sensor domain-containing protein
MVTAFGTEQGLSQSMVTQICQDSRGLMWMVTGDGLQCFNGEEFRLFRLENNKDHSISDNIMRDITEHAPGQFTVTTSSSILQFNSASGKFNVVYSKPGFYPRLLNIMVNGRLLCWSNEKGACHSQ